MISTVTKFAALLFFGLLWTFGGRAGEEAQDTDPDLREELGINDFTAPSIEKLFGFLDGFKPIPFDAVVRPVTSIISVDRSRLALDFGVLIGDAFLYAAQENSRDIDSLGRELTRVGKSLGVSQSISRHSQHLIELAHQKNWQHLRQELIVTQHDVESALLEIRDEQIVHLLSLGGWIRGLQIGAASAAASFSEERSANLRRLDVIDYFLDRLSTLAPRYKRTRLIQTITTELTSVRTRLAEPITRTAVEAIESSSERLVDLIAGNQ